MSYIKKIQNLHNIECIHDLQIKEKNQSTKRFLDNILSNDDTKIALELQKEQEKHQQIIENNKKLVQELQKEHEQQIEGNNSKIIEYSPLHMEISVCYII